MKRIRLLVTSDVHGYVYPYSYADGKKENIGFAKVKAVMDSLKDENTLLLDNGDVLEGSPLSFYHFHSHSKNISPMSKAMRLIGYDYVNVGKKRVLSQTLKMLLRIVQMLIFSCLIKMMSGLMIK